MKWLLLFIIGIAGILVWISYNNQPDELVRRAELSPAPSATPQQQIRSITFEDNDYNLYIADITDRDVSLIPNFTEKQSASTLAQANNCRGATSGGFYTPENKPLGLFIADGKTYANEVSETRLLSGFFSVTDSGVLLLSDEAIAGVRHSVQSGPLLQRNQAFSTVRDEPARRIVVAQNDSGATFLIAVTETDNIHSGPFLRDLPDIIFSLNEPTQFTNVLNLDGGAASYYQDSTKVRLSELTTVGSIICIK
ncbi:MAG TPA: phosphodiester glycosidase family protein [Patescibacteria group bacterium]|nr:phosphodiester glycosidase family protein [Patescibacteria group bacterium]